MPYVEDLNFNRCHVRPLPVGQLEVDENISNSDQLFPDNAIPVDKVGGLDGLQATVDELNVLSGITVTTDELNLGFSNNVAMTYNNNRTLATIVNNNISPAVTYTMAYENKRLASYTDGTNTWTLTWSGRKITSMIKTP